MPQNYKTERKKKLRRTQNSRVLKKGKGKMLSFTAEKELEDFVGVN